MQGTQFFEKGNFREFFALILCKSKIQWKIKKSFFYKKNFDFVYSSRITYKILLRPKGLDSDVPSGDKGKHVTIL